MVHESSELCEWNGADTIHSIAEVLEVDEKILKVDGIDKFSSLYSIALFYVNRCIFLANV